jgi:hypothetical protein
MTGPLRSSWLGGFFIAERGDRIMATVTENEIATLQWTNGVSAGPRKMHIKGRLRKGSVRIWYEIVGARHWERRGKRQYRIVQLTIVRRGKKGTLESLGFHAELMHYKGNALAPAGFIAGSDKILFPTFDEAAAACTADAEKRFGSGGER